MTSRSCAFPSGCGIQRPPLCVPMVAAVRAIARESSLMIRSVPALASQHWLPHVPHDGLSGPVVLSAIAGRGDAQEIPPAGLKSAGG